MPDTSQPPGDTQHVGHSPFRIFPVVECGPDSPDQGGHRLSLPVGGEVRADPLTQPKTGRFLHRPLNMPPHGARPPADFVVLRTDARRALEHALQRAFQVTHHRGVWPALWQLLIRTHHPPPFPRWKPSLRPHTTDRTPNQEPQMTHHTPPSNNHNKATTERPVAPAGRALRAVPETAQHVADRAAQRARDTEAEATQGGEPDPAGPTGRRPMKHPKIRKQGPNRWQVIRPAVGFSATTTTTTAYPSWQAAMASLNRQGSAEPLTTELAGQPHDGLAPIPAWDPRWPYTDPLGDHQ